MLGLVKTKLDQRFLFIVIPQNPHNTDLLSTATRLAGIPRLIYIAPAHDDAVQKAQLWNNLSHEHRSVV